MAIRNDWQTPEPIFDVLNREFDYGFDMAAADHNHKCEFYFTKNDDALSFDWRSVLCRGRAWWCNPPYNNILPWVERAVEAGQDGYSGSMLIPASTETKWFVLASQHAEWELYTPRISFVPSPAMLRYWKLCRILESDEDKRKKIGQLSPKQPNVVFHFGLGSSGFKGYRCGRTGELL